MDQQPAAQMRPETETERQEIQEARKFIPRVPDFTYLRSNCYVNRERRTAVEGSSSFNEDVVLCMCDGDGCGEQCMNRMVMYECLGGHCTEPDCQNQRFQKRQYAPLQVCHTPGKGYGLISTKPLKEGDFIIEYCGEILDAAEFRRRTTQYDEEGDEHWYFMSIDSENTIDASRMANLSRFLNHSCEPNCVTQKWAVNGEILVGFFALTDIDDNTELTFNYNFERYSDKLMECKCEAPSCTGYIGGDANAKVRELKDVEDDEGDVFDEQEIASTVRTSSTKGPARPRTAVDNDDEWELGNDSDGEDEMKPTRIGLSATGREGARRPSGGGAGGRSVNAARRPAFRRQRSSRSDSGTPTPRRRKQLSPFEDELFLLLDENRGIRDTNQMKQFVQLMARGLGSHSVEDSLSLLRALNNTVKERCLVFFVKDVDGLRFLEKMLKKFSVRENARVAKAIVQAVEKLPLAALSMTRSSIAETLELLVRDASQLRVETATEATEGDTSIETKAVEVTTSQAGTEPTQEQIGHGDTVLPRANPVDSGLTSSALQIQLADLEAAASRCLSAVVKQTASWNLVKSTRIYKTKKSSNERLPDEKSEGTIVITGLENIVSKQEVLRDILRQPSDAALPVELRDSGRGVLVFVEYRGVFEAQHAIHQLSTGPHAQSLRGKLLNPPPGAKPPEERGGVSIVSPASGASRRGGTAGDDDDGRVRVLVQGVPRGVSTDRLEKAFRIEFISLGVDIPHIRCEPSVVTLGFLTEQQAYHFIEQYQDKHINLDPTKDDSDTNQPPPLPGVLFRLHLKLQDRSQAAAFGANSGSMIPASMLSGMGGSEGGAWSSPRSGSGETRPAPAAVKQTVPVPMHVQDGVAMMRRKISEVVCKYLSKIFKEQKIANKDDFKHLCRKITHTIMEKELKQSETSATYSEEVKRKIQKYIKKFFAGLPDGRYTRKP